MWKRISSSASLSSKTSKTKTNESDGNELDRCKHRCKSVDSLLSLENSFITKGNELDRCKHRCKSVDSLLSLENSFITKNDKNNIVSVVPAEFFLLNGQILPLHITPPITPQPIISFTSTKKATMEGTMTKSTSSNSILKKEKSSSSFLSSTNSAVRFGSIEIHEHAIALGGSIPLTGPSLTLEWERLSYHKINSIDDHHRQQQQQQQKSFNKSVKRKQKLIRPRPAQERIDR
jgi:hypothetical protein